MGNRQTRKEKPYLDLRYVNLLRCSNLSQADTSPDGQKVVNDGWALEEGMIWVADILADGVSGSQTFNRKDIDELIRRKTEQNDFDAVVVFELSRLTRGGIRHGHVLADRLKKAGILLLSSTDNIVEGPEGELVASVKHYANQLQARNISLSVARGLWQSLQKDQRPASGKTAYGLDRLYRGPDGKPRMLIRWDGNIQLWLKPDQKGMPIEEVGRRVKTPRYGKNRHQRTGKRFQGYIKQPDETSELVPGSPEHVTTLVFIFTAYDLRHWGYASIVHDLNKRGVPAPEGGRWTMTSVRNILRRPIYLGIEIRNRYTCALYNKLSATGPVPCSVDQDKLEREKRSTVPQVERPREEWQLVDKPILKDLLPEQVRAAALERISTLLDPDRQPDPKRGKPIHKGETAWRRHRESPYLLSGVLQSKQTGQPMRGDTVNRKLKSGRKTYHYYFDGSTFCFADKGSCTSRPRAEPIDEAVLKEVWQALSGNRQEIARRVRKHVKNQLAQQTKSTDAENLQQERSAIVARLKAVYKKLGDLADDIVADEIQEDRQRLKAIEAELEACTNPPQNQQDPEKIVTRVMQQLDNLLDQKDEMPLPQIKELLRAVVTDLEIDLETKELTFSLVLPEFLRHNAGKNDGVRPDSPWPWPLEVGTNRPEGLEIGRYRCGHQMRGRQGCYTCRRQRPAA